MQTNKQSMQHNELKPCLQMAWRAWWTKQILKLFRTLQ